MTETTDRLIYTRTQHFLITFPQLVSILFTKVPQLLILITSQHRINVGKPRLMSPEQELFLVLTKATFSE